MTKKEYCLTNEAIASHNYYRIQIHGIEYGTDDYVYLSRLFQETYCGKTKVMFHKVKIYWDDGGQYIQISGRCFDGRRKVIVLSLDDFTRIDSMWGCGYITCKELKEFC